MKKIISTSFFALLLSFSYAQTNTFPQDGNVGIGTLYPDNSQLWDKVLELKGQNHAKLLVTTNAGIKLGMFSHLGFNAKIGTESNTNLTLTAGYWNDVMTLTTSGNVGIGTLQPQEKLSVNGNIRAKEIKVENSNWPDYVFKPSYQLMPLSRIAYFIKENGHLPDVPSAKEVSEKGIDLGANQATLLKKIEELTLHMIEMEKNLKKLEEENREIKEKLKKSN
ncbi:hypothetical protein [Sphingobacterium spiritivorum]|uniref:hypothetical protein n=1 Tax=Sphingobacterium spiritivorum TaxID=258 RepID=UPI00191B252B|nr:hypothetical protein [Sphingobacterium spiritivorum]QQT25052.1 hypothetical protein I6J02_15145 [Sphingobacterium spiritivorum]